MTDEEIRTLHAGDLITLGKSGVVAIFGLVLADGITEESGKVRVLIKFTSPRRGEKTIMPVNLRPDTLRTFSLVLRRNAL